MSNGNYTGQLDPALIERVCVEEPAFPALLQVTAKLRAADEISAAHWLSDLLGRAREAALDELDEFDEFDEFDEHSDTGSVQ